MGNANPLAVVGAKSSANDATKSVQDGFKSLTAAPTEEQKSNNARAKDRNTTYEQKKKEREERKKKLQSQWAANKSNN